MKSMMIAGFAFTMQRTSGSEKEDAGGKTISTVSAGVTRMSNTPVATQYDPSQDPDLVAVNVDGRTVHLSPESAQLVIEGGKGKAASKEDSKQIRETISDNQTDADATAANAGDQTTATVTTTTDSKATKDEKKPDSKSTK
jgi:hypothetical protein